ncbi:response regulator [Maribacter polysiphoniae]|uniref:histidine kinase n=1 Tax=Maribacter polysiphoniae TaxID=429344 RepID=A0A316E4F5_9FLAO|nr:response regulator [Maribacter polysiphoniae]MBD1260095.1 response regulator [Maribacter polysiphoniae]PWK25557.1 signal transduction histidine kinase [Maribacter polysiphoniae]
MKTHLCCLLTFWGFILSWGQETIQIDSLKRLLHENKDPTETVRLSNELFESYLYTSLDSADRYRKQIGQISKQNSYTQGNYFYNSQSGRFYFAKSNLDSAFFYIKAAATIAEELDNKSYMADNYKKISIIYDVWRNDSLSLIFINKALVNAKETDDWRLLSSIYVALGNRSFQSTQYPEALSYYLKLDSIYTNQNSLDKSLAAAYSNIGLIYSELKDAQAVKYLKKSIDVYQKLGHQEGMYYGEAALGIHYELQGNCKASIQHLLKAEDFYEEYKDANMLAEIYMRLGNCYLKEDIGKAEKYLLKSNVVSEEAQRITFLATNNLVLGNLYITRKEYRKAISYFNKTIELVSGLENNKSERLNVLAAYKGLIKTYTKIKDFEAAVATYEKSTVLEDSVKRYQNHLAVEELERKYQTEKKEQEIKLLTSQAELEKQKAKNEKSLFIAGILILGLAVIGLYFLFRNKQRTNDKLRQLEAAKSRFFANISHEFRTPLTLISGPVAHQLSKEQLSSEDKTDLGLIQRNANRLLDLVDQLLDLSKIEAGRRKLKISKGNLELFLKHLVEPFSYQSVRKGLTFNSNIKPTEEAWFDKDLVEKIIGNLLSNALKYCDENGKIDFKAEIVKDKVCIHVTNDDRNLTERDLPKLFDRFHQNNSVNQGFGIGLSLVKELAHLSHGEVKADKPNAGTVRFSVTLPISKKAFAKDELAMENSLLESAKPNPIAKMISMPEEEEQINDETLPLLLIVDDNEEIRLFIKSLLKNDYRVLQAKNGKEGVEVAFETIPDLIVSDVMMPVEDGIYLGNRLKSDERTSHIPIVLLTAKSAEEDELAGLKTGADAYMTKPFKEEKLRVVIEKLIASRTAIQEKFSKQIFLKPNEIELTSLDAQLLQRIQVILDDLLTDPNFGVTMFSDQIGLSRMHLHRKLKALTGYSTTEFIRAQRLKLAAQLIKKKGVNISEIGYAVGFNQPAYFSTCFKEYFGCSPSEYTS